MLQLPHASQARQIQRLPLPSSCAWVYGVFYCTRSKQYHSLSSRFKRETRQALAQAGSPTGVHLSATNTTCATLRNTIRAVSSQWPTKEPTRTGKPQKCRPSARNRADPPSQLSMVHHVPSNTPLRQEAHGLRQAGRRRRRLGRTRSTASKARYRATSQTGQDNRSHHVRICNAHTSDATARANDGHVATRTPSRSTKRASRRSVRRRRRRRRTRAWGR